MGQGLKQISEHVWIFPLENAKDRPNLGYIRGDKMAVAVDAGHSSSHVEDFYAGLSNEGLPLPDLTMLTHWHWDHTFGMHAVNGRTLALKETNRQLCRIIAKLEQDPAYGKEFLKSSPPIMEEYAGGVPLVVVPADELIDEELTDSCKDIDLGGVTARILQTVSPHTDDALLLYIPEDKVLFVGDAQLGEFPSWKMDYEKLHALADIVRGLDAEIIIDGHYDPFTKQEYLNELI